MKFILSLSLAFLLSSSFAMAEMIQIDCALQDPCEHNGPLELNSCIFDRALLQQTKSSLYRASLRTFADSKSRLYWGDVSYQDSRSLEFLADARYTDIRLDLEWKGGTAFEGNLFYQEFPFAIDCKLSINK